MQAVLMLAGKSTRTYPLTLTRPKPLLPIANRSIIHRSLDQLAGLFDEVILIVGYRQDMIRQALGEQYKGMRLIYQEQRQQLGTGHAILQARPHIRGRFVAMNGDDLFAHEDLIVLQKQAYAALAKRVPDPSIYGVCRVDEKNRLIDMVEKPKTFIGDLANVGCYVFEPDIFNALERVPMSERGEIEIIGAIREVAQNNDFIIIPISGFWLPTGFAWDLLAHQEFLMADMADQDIQGVVDQDATILGAVKIGHETRVEAGTIIEGPVVVGEGCEIGPDCRIHKYSAIGDGCQIARDVEIVNSIILPRVRIESRCRIPDSVIGQGCHLKAGTQIENGSGENGNVLSKVKDKWIDSGRRRLGAVLADGVETGPNSIIRTGCKIWPEMRTSEGAEVAADLMPDGAVWQ